MKKVYVIISVILLLSVLFTSCVNDIGEETFQSETEHMSDTVTETERKINVNLDGVKDYTIENIDGKYYLVFEDKEHYIDLGKNQCVSTASIRFSSLSELKDTVLNYGLSEADKMVMVYNMRSDSTGIEIINLNEMYNFEFPTAIANENHIVWCGNYYMMEYYDESLEDVWGEVEYGTKSWLDSVHEEISYLSHTENFESVEPTRIIESDGKRLDIYDVSVTDTTSLIYYVLVTECENTFLVKCISEKRVIPDDEWLLSFGLTPYEQT